MSLKGPDSSRGLSISTGLHQESQFWQPKSKYCSIVPSDWPRPPGAGERLLSLEGTGNRRESTLTGVKQSCTSQSERKRHKNGAGGDFRVKSPPIQSNQCTPCFRRALVSFWRWRVAQMTMKVRNKSTVEVLKVSRNVFVQCFYNLYFFHGDFLKDAVCQSGCRTGLFFRLALAQHIACRCHRLVRWIYQLHGQAMNSRLEISKVLLLHFSFLFFFYNK